jgi:hypothetical protein
LEALFQHLPGKAEEKHEHSVRTIDVRLSFKQGTFRSLFGVYVNEFARML